MLTVRLENVGNIDHGQNPFETLYGVKNKTVEVKSIAEASKVCKKYIEDNNLGGGNFSGGQVFEDGVQIAWISYNGRAWDMDDNEIEV